MFQFTQSMEIDTKNEEMWIIDRGSPIACPPKLIIISMTTGEILHSHDFPSTVLNQAANFVNDIVIDPDRQFAYMSDVGVGPLPTLHEGGIIVFDRANDVSHRLEHDSMKSEPDGANVTINGEHYDYSGSPTDGIALSPDKSQLYWCPLGGVHLWQMPSADARSPDGVNLDEVIRDLGPKVSLTDGMIMGHKGIYFGAMGFNAVYMWDYKSDMDSQGATLENVKMDTQTRLVQDNVRMIWPDTFAMDGKGWVWSTPNQLPMAFAGQLDFTGNDINFRLSKTYVDDVSYLDDVEDPSNNSNQSCFNLLLLLFASVFSNLM